MGGKRPSYLNPKENTVMVSLKTERFIKTMKMLIYAAKRKDQLQLIRNDKLIKIFMKVLIFFSE